MTERLANVGLNVDQADQALHRRRSVDRLGGRGSVREGLRSASGSAVPPRVTTHAYPDLALQGRVSYIDPQVSPDIADGEGSYRSAERAQ